MERGDHNIVPRHGGLPSSPMDFRVAHGEDSIKTPNAPLESPNRSPPYRQATDSPPKPFDEVGALFTVRRPTDLGRTPNHPSNSLPRVVILDTTLDNVCEEKSCDMSGFHVNISSTTTQSAANQTVGQILYKSSASSANSSQFPDVNWHRPNNYEVAMHGRQSPHTVTGGFDPRFGTLAAESVNAFYADADLTISNVAAVSSPHRTYGAKRGGVPRGLSTLQIPNKTPFQNRFRSPTHLIPSSSSRGTAEYPQLQYAYGRDDPPSTPTTPFCASPIEHPSPISTSPSSLSDTSEGITRCPSCPDKVFKGTPVAQKNSLQRHRRDAHNGMPRLECLVRGCTVTFAPGRKDNRMKHIRATHPDYPLPALSTKRKRKADSGLESCWAYFILLQYAEGETTRCLVYCVQRHVLRIRMAWILAILYTSQAFVAVTLATRIGRIIFIIIVLLQVPNRSTAHTLFPSRDDQRYNSFSQWLLCMPMDSACW